MSYVKARFHDELVNPNFSDLTMWDVTQMFVDHVVTRATKVEFFDGTNFIPNTTFSLFECKKSVLFSLGANKLELLQEGDNFVVVKDVFEKRVQFQILKFSL